MLDSAQIVSRLKAMLDLHARIASQFCWLYLTRPERYRETSLRHADLVAAVVVRTAHTRIRSSLLFPERPWRFAALVVEGLPVVARIAGAIPFLYLP